MLKSLVEVHTGQVLTEAQLNSLARLATEWLFGPRDISGIPGLAADLLATGFGTDQLAMLAGLSRRNEPSEILALFEAAMADLGFNNSAMGRQEDSDLRARLCCELIKRGCVRPTVGARRLSYTYFYDSESDLSDAFLSIVYLYEEWESSDVEDQELFDRLILAEIEQKGLAGD